MTVFRVESAILSGLEVQRIGVEVDVRRGLPNFTVVGLAQDAVRESRDRVLAALKNSGFEVPAMKVTVNLTPVSLRKTSSLLDLPIAVGLLAASKQIPAPHVDTVFLGELSLDGSVRSAPGVLALLDGLGESVVVLPHANLEEAAHVSSPARSRRKRLVRGLSNLSQLASPLDCLPSPPRSRRHAFKKPVSADGLDFSDIRGQHLARRACELAAAGGHHLLLVGPPGTGKSMLAHRLPTLLPSLSAPESLEVTKLYNVAGMHATPDLIRVRPFRSPHHTLSDVALIGGGPQSLPGEISLAHRGVLFLDEFPEFPRSCLEALRQPLEDRRVLISRASAKIAYPANFILIGAMNPCPCGYYGHPIRPCRCRATDISRYFNKLSGPIIDRIDLQAELSPENPDLIFAGPSGEPSASILKRVESARKRQSARFGRPDRLNAHMNSSDLRTHCALSSECQSILQAALRRMQLSARSLEKVIKVARTAADLAGAPDIDPAHILEAVRFRALDLLTISRN